MSDVNGAYDLANEHAEMLATRWWTADEFRELGEYNRHLRVHSSLTQDSRGAVPRRSFYLRGDRTRKGRDS